MNILIYGLISWLIYYVDYFNYIIIKICDYIIIKIYNEYNE